MSEIPRHWRKISERTGLRTEVVLHAPNYDVVKTFGSNLLIVSRDGYKNVPLSSLNDSEVIYPELKDSKDRHVSTKSRIVYPVPE